MGRIKNNFSLILRSTCHSLHCLHDAQICRRVVGEKKPIKFLSLYLEVCFKISNECGFDTYSNGFFFFFFAKEGKKYFFSLV